jgi:hypothetical protein
LNINYENIPFWKRAIVERRDLSALFRNKLIKNESWLLLDEVPALSVSKSKTNHLSKTRTGSLQVESNEPLRGRSARKQVALDLVSLLLDLWIKSQQAI